jgi:hypothetical protein
MKRSLLNADSNLSKNEGGGPIPIDRRSARTRVASLHALLSLIGKKRYDAITIKHICRTANVGRSTFLPTTRAKMI